MATSSMFDILPCNFLCHKEQANHNFRIKVHGFTSPYGCLQFSAAAMDQGRE